MSSNTETEEVAVGLMAILGCLLWLPIIVYRWFVQWCVWGWYIVPVFAAPSLTFGQSIIIFMVLRFLLPKSHTSKTFKNSKEMVSTIFVTMLASVIYSTVILVLGSIFKMS